MEAPGQSYRICFTRWAEWMDTINGINLYERSRYGWIFTRVFCVLQLLQLLIVYNFVVVCLTTDSLEQFSFNFNQFGGVLLTFLRCMAIHYNRKNLQKTANFIDECKFHHLSTRAGQICHKTLRSAKRFLNTLLGFQLVTLVSWYALTEYQARTEDILLPMVSYHPFNTTHWTAGGKFAFRFGYYVAYAQLLVAFFGSYVITSSFLLMMILELRILNDSYEAAPTSPRPLVAFLRDRIVYKEHLLEHIGILKQQMNLSRLFELLFIVCLLTINALRLCLTSNNLKEIALSACMILIYVLEMFQYCYLVDVIEQLHEGQAIAAYSTPWYEAPMETKALVLITIRMSQVPLCFMCGGMYRLSSELFASMIKFIYSMVTLLLQFK